MSVHPLDAERQPGRAAREFSSDLHCADCDIHYRDPVPNLFSFNSPLGACETCRGFGRTIGIDYDLVIPDDTQTPGAAARSSRGRRESYTRVPGRPDALRRAGAASPLDVPWRD